MRSEVLFIVFRALSVLTLLMYTVPHIQAPKPNVPEVQNISFFARMTQLSGQAENTAKWVQERQKKVN